MAMAITVIASRMTQARAQLTLLAGISSLLAKAQRKSITTFTPGIIITAIAASHWRTLITELSWKSFSHRSLSDSSIHLRNIAA